MQVIPEGRTVELGEVGSIVVPTGATVEERVTGTPAQQLVVTFGDITQSAVEVTWSKDDPVTIDEQTLLMEEVAQTNTSISDYQRARVTWPGSVQSVVATWKEAVAQADGAARSVDGMRLAVQDEARTTVVVVAFAPEGEWTGSDAESVLLSLSLG